MKILINAAAGALLFYCGRQHFYICSLTVCSVMCLWAYVCMHTHWYRTKKKRSRREKG